MSGKLHVSPLESGFPELRPGRSFGKTYVETYATYMQFSSMVHYCSIVPQLPCHAFPHVHIPPAPETLRQPQAVNAPAPIGAGQVQSTAADARRFLGQPGGDSGLSRFFWPAGRKLRSRIRLQPL